MGGNTMRRSKIIFAAGAASLLFPLTGASAQQSLKIGLILPMTGPFASTGRQIEAAVKLYVQQNGDTVAGKKIEVVVKDDAGVADTTKRLAQELIVNDKVGVIAGFGLTPLALAPAPLATQAKVPEIVMAAATSTITEASPYIVRTSFTLRRRRCLLRTGPPRTVSRRSSPSSPTMAPASMPKRPFRATSRRQAGRSKACAFRSRIRTSRPSCRGRPTPSPTRCSSSCPRVSA